jgi:hypothetical protein
MGMPLETAMQSRGRSLMYAIDDAKYQNWLALLLIQGAGPAILDGSAGTKPFEQRTRVVTSDD